MKLHKISLENLNSLYGQHSIDLSQDLRDAPLFLIMGQTGAGKSTILDAICLALFGETPRLTRQRGQLRTDSRIVMSQGTGECTATVEFSKLVEDGQRCYYRASWSCRRSRGRADGRLQHPERSMEELNEQRQVVRVLASGSKRADYEPVFHEVLEGMNVSDFKRSMMLAQGEFAAFIKADHQARASILERLTNTEIYRKIGQRAALRMRDAKEVYVKLKAEADSFDLMSPAEVQALEQQAQQAQEQLQRRRQEQEQARAQTQWLDRRLSLSDRQRQAEASLEQAHARRAAQEGDAVRLREDERCQVAAPVLREVQRLEPVLEELGRDVARHREAERTYQLSLDQAAQQEELAQKRKVECMDLLEEMRPKLKRARELRQALRQARDEHRLARHSFMDAQEKEGKAREQLRATEETLAEAQATLERRQRRSERLAYLEPLTRELGGFKEKHRSLEQHQERLARQRQQEAREVQNLEELRQRLQETRRELAQVEEALAPLIRQRDQAREALEVQLKGAHSAQERRQALDEQHQSASHRLQASQQSLRLLQEHTRLGDSLEQTRRDLASLQEQLRETKQEEGRLQQQQEQAEQRLRDLREHLDDLQLAVSLSRERASLKEGRACPLCGSEGHPYAHDVDLHEQDERLRARCDAQVQKVDEVERLRHEAGEHIARLRVEFARLEAQVQSRQARLEEDQARHEELGEHLQHALGQAGVGAQEANAQALQARCASLEAERQQAAQARRELDSAEEAQRKAEGALHQSSTHGERLRGLLENLGSREEVFAQSLERTREEISATDVLRLQAQQELVQVLVQHQVEIPWQDEFTPNLGEALGEATRLVGNFLDTRNALGQAQLEQEQALRAHEQARSLWGECSRRLEERTEVLKARQEQVDTLELDVARDRFAGDPDESEQEFRRAVRDAERDLLDAQKRASAFREEMARAVAVRQEREKAHAETQRRLEESQASLRGHLEALGLADRASLLTTLLGDADRAALRQGLEALEGAIREAHGALEAIKADVDSHEGARPAAMLLTVTLEELQHLQAQAEQAHEEALRQHLALVGRLEDHQRRATQQQELQDELARVTREYELWHEMHQLIGVKDGEKFKLFAQILNLQELIDKANQRLSWLEPRYTLVVQRDEEGEPSLDFAVRDAHYAGQERPLTTLSGGETFLVSLSMALALADYRSVRMPIETLLLDEGLGTLDEETLDIVMSALERLHSRGTQVGIISHIASLQERLQARVVVEKMGGGRSSFRFEFGQTPEASHRLRS